MRDLDDLVSGFRRFQHRYFVQDRSVYDRLTRAGQSPAALVIACCDARVDPAIVTDSDPGDLFVVRNVANLVPPYETGGHYHGTSAALEFAVCTLKVRHVIVLGHAQCGGIRALIETGPGGNDTGFVAPWMSIAEDARREVERRLPAATPEARAQACEQAAIRVSLRNLASFPFVSGAIARGALDVHGWYFDMTCGRLLGCRPGDETFVELVGATGGEAVA